MDRHVTRSFDGLVVGATDPGASVAFLSVFGLESVAQREVPAATAEVLWGLNRATTEIELATAGVARPSVWVVHCDAPGSPPSAYQRRARALDLYVRSMDEALDHLSFAGIGHGPVGTLSVGPVTMRQCLVAGPDGIAVVLVESTHRRASVLDDDLDPESRTFSEGHSVVWCVDDMDADAAWFVERGLTKGMGLAFSEPEVSTYLDLADSPVPIRMTMLSGEAVEPLRLELLEFPEHGDEGGGVAPPGAGRSADVLRGGLWALRVRSEDPGVTRSPGGVRVEFA